jgi:hypothetical protein
MYIIILRRREKEIEKKKSCAAEKNPTIGRPAEEALRRRSYDIIIIIL